MHEPWSVNSTRAGIDHPYVRVDFQEVELPDGRVIPDWPIVHARNYVNVLVLDEAGAILVIDGYKHGIGRSSWQILGGYLEEGEDPLDTAQRELLEETGCEAPEWHSLGSFVVDSNRHVGVGHFFLARGARQIAEPDNDDLEEVELRWVPRSDLLAALRDGRVAGLGYATAIGLGLLALDEPR